MLRFIKNLQLIKTHEEDNFESVEMTIVYPPALDWNFLFQRPQQLMTAFSKIKNVRAIFINTEIYTRQPHPIVKLAENLFIVRQGVRYEHIIRGKKVLWFSAPSQYNWNDSSYSFDLTVFDYLDNSANEFAVWKQYIPLCFKRADVVFTTAKVMYEEHKNDGKPLFLLPNGADYEHFKKARVKLPTPQDFPKVKEGEKVVGFHGALATWIDYELITEIAKEFKVVLIGNNKFYNKTIKHPNVFILPHKDYKDLPYYISQFDVALVPFKLTEMSRGVDPIKFYEYISAGKPVVATKMEELLLKYKDITYFVDRLNSANEVVGRALRENNSKKEADRIRVAKENSWDSRALFAVKVLNQYLGG